MQNFIWIHDIQRTPKLQKSDTRYEAAWSQILIIRGYFSTRWDGIWDLTASHSTHPPMTKPCLLTSSNNVAANYYCQQCFVSWFQKNIQSMLKLTVKNIYVNEYLESTHSSLRMTEELFQLRTKGTTSHEDPPN